MFRPTTAALLLALFTAPAFAVPPAGGGYYGGYYRGSPGLYSPGYFGGAAPGLYAPGYFSRNYYRPYYYPTPSVYYVPTYYPSVYVYESGAPGGYVSPERPGRAPADNTASVAVHVPAEAEVWFNDDPTKQKGENRVFVTPPLAPGRDYQYEVRARWTENGKPVDQTRTVVVQPNERSDVDFTKPESPRP